MKRIKCILVILLCLLLSGCLGAPEVSRTYPLKDYMIVDMDVVAVFIVDGKEKTYSFEEHLVYSCEEESIVTALFWEHLVDMPEEANEIYLYLNEEDYNKYREEIVAKRKEMRGAE